MGLFDNVQRYFTMKVNSLTAMDGKFQREVYEAMRRFKKQDWGDVSDSDKACNDEDLLTFSISRFPDLIYLWIESFNFKNVSTFEILNNTHLEYIHIQDYSFTLFLVEYGVETTEDEIRSKSFRILNCEELKSIDIGRQSFSDFGGEFELKNLPQLQSINIGDYGSSYNFYSSSFIIRGILIHSYTHFYRYAQSIDYHIR